MIRAVLESHAAADACQHATDEDVDAADELHQRIAALSPDDPAITGLNPEFHMRIYEAAGSALLIGLIRQTWAQSQGGPQLVWRPHAESVAQHAEQVEAFRRRDAERLSSQTREHILGPLNHMQRALEREDT